MRQTIFIPIDKWIHTVSHRKHTIAEFRVFDLINCIRATTIGVTMNSYIHNLDLLTVLQNQEFSCKMECELRRSKSKMRITHASLHIENKFLTLKSLRSRPNSIINVGDLF